MTHPNQAPSPSDIRQEDVREEIHRVLTHYFYTGEPGEYEAVETATDVLAALSGAPVAWRWKPQGATNWILVFDQPKHPSAQPLYASPPPQPDTAPAIGATSAADEIISQIETRFPDWLGFRDLVDCIDVTLHRLRGGS